VFRLLLSNCSFDSLPMTGRPVAIDHSLVLVMLAKSRFEISSFTEAFDQSARVGFHQGIGDTAPAQPIKHQGGSSPMRFASASAVSARAIVCATAFASAIERRLAIPRRVGSSSYRRFLVTA